MILELCSAANLRTPRDALEEAEDGEQPPTAQAAKPTEAQLHAEAKRLIESASPELREAVGAWLRRTLLTDDTGKPRPAEAVANRLSTAIYLLVPAEVGSMQQVADVRGISRAAVCKIAKRLSTRGNLPAAPHRPRPGNEGGGPRGQAKVNHELRLARRSPLEAEADKILERAGHRP